MPNPDPFDIELYPYGKRLGITSSDLNPARPVESPRLIQQRKNILGLTHKSLRMDSLCSEMS